MQSAPHRQAAVAGWQRTAARLAGPVLAVVVALWVVARIVVPPPPGMAHLDPAPWHLAMTAYGVIGVVIVNRRPDNVVGWLFYVVGVFDPLSAAVRAVAIAGITTPGASLAHTAAWLQSWMWAPSLGALALLLWVFPTGRPLPGIWRWGAGLAVAATLVLIIVAPPLLWAHRGLALLEEVDLGGAAGLVTNAAFFALMLSAALGAVSLIVRLRRSRGEERQQLKWFAYAAALVMVQAFADIVILDGLGVGDSMAREVVSSAVLSVVPISAAIAVLKYRLYEIDRLINRTVVYGALTAGCAGMYLLLVALGRLLTHELTGDTTVAVAVSTLAVAALVRPARRHLQSAVDRRFNRARYDAGQTVAQFSSRLRDEVELSTLATDLVQTVHTTMQPRTVALWLADAPS